MCNSNLETQKCTKCKVNQPLNRFTEGRTQCNLCLETKRRYRETHREEINEKAKQYYSNNKDYRLEYQKQYREQRIECKICKVMISRNKKSEHEKTKTHIHNLRNLDNPKLTYKQMHQQKQKDKDYNEKQKIVEHQQVIEYLNNTFPAYPEEEF